MKIDLEKFLKTILESKHIHCICGSACAFFMLGVSENDADFALPYRSSRILDTTILCDPENTHESESHIAGASGIYC